MNSQIDTSGGAYIGGNADVGRQFVGRDNITLNIIATDPKELVQSLLAGPLKNRSDQWMDELGQTISSIHQHIGGSLEDLQSNDLFMDTVLRASQLALKTSQKEKREALRNAITNSILPDAPDEILQQMFLNLIDECSVWHIRVLKLLSGSVEVAEVIGRQIDEAIEARHQEFRLQEEKFPVRTVTRLGPDLSIEETNRLMLEFQAENVVRRWYREAESYAGILVQYLVERGLVIRCINERLFSVSPKRRQDKTVVYRWTTDIGDKFIKFIESPF